MDKKLQIASLVGEIQTLGYMINTFTDFCVFTSFSGHVDKIDVRVASSKENYSDILLKGDAYTNASKWSDDDSVIKKLVKVKYELRKILRKHDIDYSRLNYETEVVRHYKLT